MKTLLWMLFAGLSVSVLQAQSASPSTVLVLVNDAYLPETGTNGVGASVYVGEHYAEMRNIPSGNVLHLDIPYAGYQSDGQWHGMQYDANQFLSYADYLLYIQTPVQQFLSENPQILYIVTTYGVPSMLADTVWRLSIDSLLVAMYSGTTPVNSPSLANPYQDPSADGNAPHFADWANPGGYRMCLVTRLDGPSAVIAASLVDKAIQAEETLTKPAGMAYFDWQNLPASNIGYYPTDQTILNDYNEAVSLGIPATLNNQAITGTTIQSAPNSSWVWGWYQVIITDAYSSPVSGSIASQAPSYTC
ncbi:MAG: TIGR03790 family protein, partial [Bryobacteraceae bacterium]